MKVTTIGVALLISVFGHTAQAQDALASATQAVVAAGASVHVTAHIVSIDTGARTLGLKGPRGNVAVVAVNPEVAGFDELKIGDKVEVLYKNALLLTADKISGADSGIRKRVDTQTYLPGATNAPGKAGYASAHRVELIATVLKVDNKKRLVTLRGPYQSQTLAAGPDIELSDLKAGDTVHAVFESATAVQVTPQVAQAQ
ncbi:hypothetical protein R69927_04265 [Paraburkholderia domus]|uniref:Copper-binding protein n=1 Tax=Paraburkholderia domus TaxID=2793075 RepID=A0A9N8R385_9BURK|nr:hypothetical protein [Paraburkholderia domus]MBK5063507.1 hypothetical protein [Burkholderia sp. R-70199]MBK5088502.1 hypothetical protein [Burkholderia sp. R-69927]MBK5123684.1 hypothetical protein [Burkholderia sp. R-69980]MBK5169126.1 hypothetical protein [Burkholderia sp. R-70211]MBK5183607.1 hypothetical protein [Burkholderia sp. R-69749]MCI0148665.1 hypothetical protein [Paraburkholderia sediminicola]